MEKITLAMPVYNAAGFIRRSLLSALNQTYPEIEFLIINDGGTDNTMEIIQEVLQLHPRSNDLHIIHHPQNCGIGATRNTAIHAATGHYLFFMDDDDEITPDCIEILYNKMTEHPVDFVAASFVRRDTEGNIYPGCSYKDTLIEDKVLSVADYRYRQSHEIFVASWNKLYRLDFLRRNHIQCIPNHLNEDPWFTYQVILSARSCRLLPDCTLYYSLQPQSVCENTRAHGYSERICRQYVEIQKLKSEYIVALRDTSVYPGLLYDIMFMSLYHGYRILSPTGGKNKIDATRKQLAYDILTKKFRLPSRISFDKNYLRFVTLYLLFSLPVKVKYSILRLCILLDLRERIRKWIHF